MYKKICINGGGIKGVLFIYSLQLLNKFKLLDNIKEYIGSSVGSILVTLLNIGYTVDEIIKISKLEFEKYTNVKILNFISELGLDNGNKIEKLLKSIIKQKVNSEITFIELYKKTKKKLTITGSCLNDNKTYYFNKDTNPNMKIIKALRISISFIGYFKPVIYNNKVFIDGSFFSPNTEEYYKKTDDLLILKCSTELREIKTEELKQINNYYVRFLECIKERYLNSEKKYENIINIKFKYFAMNLKLTDEIRKEMRKIGKKETLIFIMKNYKKIQKYIAFKKLIRQNI